MEPKGKTLVVGMGNLLLWDEGVGVHVLQEMKKMKLSEGLELLDIGTSTMDLIYSLNGVGKLIVIDAMRAGGAPGTIYECSPEDLLPKEGSPISLHEIGLLETLSMAQKKGMRIETMIIGVEPKVLEWGIELSVEVASKIPNIIEAILREI
jgi:hydrogenase maturation protease